MITYPIVEGSAEIKFSKLIEFENGGGVLNYIIVFGVNHSSINLKQFYNNNEKPDILENGTLIDFKATLYENKYKSNQDQSWKSNLELKSITISVKTLENDDLTPF